VGPDLFGDLGPSREPASRTTILGLLTLILAGTLVTWAGSGTTAPAAPVERHYYVRAENEEWMIAPTGYMDDKLGRFVDGAKTSFTAIVLRGYEDGAFTRPLPRPSWMGILGPTLEARVGDTVVVHFRNEDRAYNRPHSLHTHGFHYDAAFDGGYMPHAGPQPAAAVPPGGEFVYRWQAGPDSVGTWLYHDHSVEAEDTVRRGMIGAVVIHKPDEPPAREFVLLFSAFPRGTTHLRRDFFTINGRAFMGALPGLEARVGERVRFRVVGMGDEFHTFHLHGHRWQAEGRSVDTVVVGPATTATAEFVEDAPGLWMLHCHVLEHLENGMMQHYRVTGP
jgi:FtsP/CotA-like multicopper oxidase with cupredoxin domain